MKDIWYEGYMIYQDNASSGWIATGWEAWMILSWIFWSRFQTRLSRNASSVFLWKKIYKCCIGTFFIKIWVQTCSIILFISKKKYNFSDRNLNPNGWILNIWRWEIMKMSQYLPRNHPLTFTFFYRISNHRNIIFFKK